MPIDTDRVVRDRNLRQLVRAVEPNRYEMRRIEMVRDSQSLERAAHYAYAAREFRRLEAAGRAGYNAAREAAIEQAVADGRTREQAEIWINGILS